MVFGLSRIERNGFLVTVDGLLKIPEPAVGLAQFLEGLIKAPVDLDRGHQQLAAGEVVGQSVVALQEQLGQRGDLFGLRQSARPAVGAGKAPGRGFHHNHAPAAQRGHVVDGGRVLRSVLWRRSGDRVRAATSAARAGQVFAYILVTLGVLEFLEVGIIGLWFVFLGWYLLTAARAEESAVVLRSSLASVHVRDIMTPDPVTFSATTTVAELIDTQLHHHRFNTYPLVGADGELEGLTTMGRIRHVPASARETTRLIDVACPLAEVPIGAPSEPIPELLQRMQAAADGRALVIDEKGAFVGIVSPSDIARYVQLCMLQSQGRSPRRG